jgi:hypothetical protein
MDGYNVVSLFSSDNCTDATESDRSAAIENLQRKVSKMHAQHVLASLLRAVVFGSLLILGLKMVEYSWGNALAIIAGFLLMRTLMFSIKGHWSISRFRKAKMYWLQDESAEQDDSPVYLQTESPVSERKAG